MSGYRHNPVPFTEAVKRKIDTPEGRKTYSRRLGVIEPVFANVRAPRSLDRFTLLGPEKVNIQWKLYCLVHNLEKLSHRTCKTT